MVRIAGVIAATSCDFMRLRKLRLIRLSVATCDSELSIMSHAVAARRIPRLLDKLYWRLANRITPGLFNSHHRYIQTLERMAGDASRWLDLGCGHQIVPRWFKQADEREARLKSTFEEIVGVDLDMPSLKQNRCHDVALCADLTCLPFPDASFDLVSANMVAEHVEDPAALLAEVSRVLRPGGRFVFHTPNVLHPPTLLVAGLPQWAKNVLARVFEGREAADVFPTWYRMNRECTIREQALHAGLETWDLDLCNTTPETVMLGPLVVFELMMIRLTSSRIGRPLRSNIVAILQRQQTGGADADAEAGDGAVNALDGESLRRRAA